MVKSRRNFLKAAGMTAGAVLFSPADGFARTQSGTAQRESESVSSDSSPADYTLRIKTVPVEIAPKKIISLTTYNGQFPGPLVRLREGKQAVIDVYNETDVAEQLHWHGQMIPVEVDGSAEEGTPFIPARGRRRIVFTPKPAGFRFYHTHNRGGADFSAGQYGGEVGPVYIEPRHEPGNYDREVFLVLKEFEPTFSRGGDMPQDFLSPATKVKELQEQGESSMKASLAKGMPHGYEVGYGSFTINGRMLHHGEPIRVKQGERVLFHILNGSATEIRSLALPGHAFHVVALDGNPVPNPATVPGLWLGTAERISAIVQMNHPGIWIMGDLADDDRRHGMGVVVEYAGHKGKPQWVAAPHFRWSYARFAKPGATAPSPDETLEMTFVKENAAEEGFNRWTINGVAYPMANVTAPASFHLRQGKRYRLHMRNASDDIHPIHLHRHSFELTSFAGQPTAGLLKDVFMLGGYQEATVDFVADNPGLTLFHCHQQLHMDYGFMTLFDYV
ncbi:MAG TPA: multicopper oxidase domain-containing protein [Candidatus Angelobacter sp.]